MMVTKVQNGLLDLFTQVIRWRTCMTSTVIDNSSRVLATGWSISSRRDNYRNIGDYNPFGSEK